MEPNSAIAPANAAGRSSVALGLSGRYATALFDLAVDAGSLDTVGTSLATLKDALAGSDDLKALTNSPMVSRKQAAAGIAAVAGSLGLDKLTTAFLGVLAGNRRLGTLSAIIRDFTALAAARRGEISARVTAAHPLSADQQQALAAKLKAGLGRDVALDITVDPAILGGLIVRVGSRMIDSSLKTRLDSLGQALKG
ncbi:ATP synthase subunit delta [Polymorphobacter glacialis]|uniref:ATP synthase subunit delta n=1 Tax=Sandarakinorhabdus glacialis TaxID=1614636 RepID=A0A916ZX94_9SPHN|nr:ATP synthase subunit delta [Polymorphobacter glacialis]